MSRYKNQEHFTRNTQMLMNSKMNISLHRNMVIHLSYPLPNDPRKNLVSLRKVCLVNTVIKAENAANRYFFTLIKNKYKHLNCILKIPKILVPLRTCVIILVQNEGVGTKLYKSTVTQQLKSVFCRCFL